MNKPTVKYPVGIQSFSEIREGGYVYVDKTELIYELATTGKVYFLSRPRRFGKSLLLSTLKAYFEGRKDLFEGLAIAALEKDWVEYPVITLSLARYNPVTRNLLALLENELDLLEQQYGKFSDTKDISLRFGNIIQSAYETSGKKVVVLIDEYDAPLVAHLEDDSITEEVRSLLKSVYSNLKDKDDYLKFTMLTGVSRFSRMTVFSGLNNLDDITMEPRWSEICGVTEGELTTYFQDGISALADALDIDFNEALGKLKENYDGYHFTVPSADIYNPYSLLKVLKHQRISSYWFVSGTPTFLVKTLAATKSPLTETLDATVSEMTLSEIETYHTSPAALLFQTGYLTIKGYDPRRNRYRLGIPNREVESGFFLELLSYNTGEDKDRVDNKVWDIRDAFEEGNPDKALDIARSFLAGIPGNLTANRPEIYFENNLFLLFKLVGIDARAEWWTSDGRIDILLNMEEYVYVIELKLDGSPEEALAQIDRKEYALQWRHDGRKVFRIGVNISSTKRNIEEWEIEQ